MRRVVIIGSYGAGKTVLAGQLGELLAIPVHHIDAVRWRPGWKLAPTEEWLETLARIVSEPAWIIDGNFERTLEPRLAAADTVIFLDFPLALSLWRVIRRRLSRKPRRDLPSGLEERLGLQVIRLVDGYRRETRPKLLELLSRYGEGREVITLRRPREARVLLETLAASTRDGRATPPERPGPAATSR